MSDTIDLALQPTAVAPPPTVQRRQWLDTLRRACRLTRTRIGLAIVAVMVLIAVFGPLVAPNSPTEFVAPPNSARRRPPRSAPTRSAATC